MCRPARKVVQDSRVFQLRALGSGQLIPKGQILPNVHTYVLPLRDGRPAVIC